MKNEICRKIQYSLVDYSDGALSSGDARQIAEHLARCPACREELRLLEHSLAFAREVWNESAAAEPLALCDKPLAVSHLHKKPLAVSRGTDNSSPAVSRLQNKPLAVSRKKFRRTLVWLSGAAAASAVAVLLLLSRPAKPQEEFDVMRYIAREECSARLAASVQILAGAPDLKQYKEEAEDYLKKNYADTAAVRMLDKQRTSIE